MNITQINIYQYNIALREPIEVAKSTVRLKLKNTDFYRGKFTTRKALEIYERHQAQYAELMPQLNHIKVEMEDFVAKDPYVIGYISDFIGRKLNTDAITPNESWAISGVIK